MSLSGIGVALECTLSGMRMGTEWYCNYKIDNFNAGLSVLRLRTIRSKTTLRLLMLVGYFTIGLTFSDAKSGTGTLETLHWTYSWW